MQAQPFQRETVNMFTYRLARDDELALAFCLAIRRTGLSEPIVRQRADSLLAVARRQHLDTSEQWLAERDGRPISACSCCSEICRQGRIHSAQITCSSSPLASCRAATCPEQGGTG